MGHWRKTLMSALVWLTAALTAVAGTPHLLCHCVNGSIRVPGLFSASQACCVHKPPHHAAQKPTCPHCRPHTVKPAGPELTAPSCHQTMAKAVVYSSPDARPVFNPIGCVETLPAAETLALTFSAQTGRRLTLREPDQQPPPTERVIALQRFLI